MNAYIRIKWTLTEDTPLIKAYDETLWAKTPDIQIDPMISIQLLKALHVKFVALLSAIPGEDLKRQFIHPETQTIVHTKQVCNYRCFEVMLTFGYLPCNTRTV